MHLSNQPILFNVQEQRIAYHVILKEVSAVYKNIKCPPYVAIALGSIALRLVLITIVLRINALSFKTNFRRAHGLPVEEMNDLTLAKFPESSNIGCACLCSSYLQCTSYSLATGLCTLMTQGKM